MKHWITFPKTSGVYSQQAHCDLPDGSYEREFAREGFFGPATHIYHRHPPTGWTHWEGELAPRAFDGDKLCDIATCPLAATPLFHNAHVRVRQWRASGAMDHLVANADGDELLFVHNGRGQLYCDFGHLAIEAGDYVLLPRATKWRTEWEADATVLLIESTGDALRLPDRGMVGPHAVFDPAVLAVPEIDDAFVAQREDENPWTVLMSRRGRVSRVMYPRNPLDAIGYKGDLLPVRLHVRDIRPLMSHRYHLPPSAHTTFLSNRVVVCTFVPRPKESDPGALTVPFFHSNNDYDELIFYHQGKFFSRDNIHPGMFTLHPAGFPHGPHPKALRLAEDKRKQGLGNGAGVEMLDEVAVMIDTRDPLEFTDAACTIEDPTYVQSWSRP